MGSCARELGGLGLPHHNITMTHHTISGGLGQALLAGLGQKLNKHTCQLHGRAVPLREMRPGEVGGRDKEMYYSQRSPSHL